MVPICCCAGELPHGLTSRTRQVALTPGLGTERPFPPELVGLRKLLEAERNPEGGGGALVCLLCHQC